VSNPSRPYGTAIRLTADNFIVNDGDLTNIRISFDPTDELVLMETFSCGPRKSTSGSTVGFPCCDDGHLGGDCDIRLSAVLMTEMHRWAR
jgi:hypothetical protein